MELRRLGGLREIASQYTMLFVDQWGVMHNGYCAFPEALNCLEECCRLGLRVVSISNSSRRGAESNQNLERLGFVQGKHYHCLVTSGETVRKCLKDYRDRFGRRVLSINWTIGDSLLSGPGWIIENDIETVDWILCSGVPHGQLVSDFSEQLKRARDRRIPMVCANPDVLTVSADNTLNPCPGAIAHYYEDLGGHVHWHGKPKREIYNFAVSISGLPDIAREQILGIGDSLAHDIAGVKNFGGAACLVANGIHRNELLTTDQKIIDIATLAAQHKSPEPDYIIANLAW